MLIAANQPFGAWSKVFPDQAMTLAAIDRLVHHAQRHLKKAAPKKILAKLNNRHDHTFATGRRFKL